MIWNHQTKISKDRTAGSLVKQTVFVYCPITLLHNYRGQERGKLGSEFGLDESRLSRSQICGVRLADTGAISYSLISQTWCDTGSRQSTQQPKAWLPFVGWENGCKTTNWAVKSRGRHTMIICLLNSGYLFGSARYAWIRQFACFA